ncbi:hypothetical protein EG328_006221 [Venturia inaequalis]|uniref:Brix domain-containing protein n=1 Tax=Venturia inaequalis TaxID=5025 RepID=A0A8H3VEI2_VENIN|nr:hypothetical protein EG327_009746 [Venturia inaequalis]KAE9986218.1 hypothetical protein EG328_006221 [Venturia inaequalis]
MPSINPKSALPYKSANKDRRRDFHIKQKKARDQLQREKRFARKKLEDKNPELRELRLAANKPITIDSKRKYDEEGEEGDNILGLSVDLNALAKRRRLEELQELDDAAEANAEDEEDAENQDDDDEAGGPTADDFEKEDKDEDDNDSMLGDSDAEGESMFKKPAIPTRPRSGSIAASVASTARTDLTPEAIAAKFPTLFAEQSDNPKVLITTSINSTLHKEAEMLEELFPNSAYVRRSSHRWGHKFSIREIAKFASNRNFTTMVVLMEDQKRPAGLDIIHLPEGPHLHYSLTNWIDGKRLPGHGKAMDFYPEIILNNFTTALGLVTGKMFQHLFPIKPELQGRQVVTLHNQRDFIFFRRHRYAFREKRAREQAVLGPDGKPIEGVEDIKAGLQELGPRFTLKLRRVDKGIQRASGQEWEWKGKTDRVRTKFQL